MKMLFRVLPVFLVTALLAGLYAHAQSDGWLTGSTDRDEQIALIEDYIGGYSGTMMEVGYRFESTHQAIQDDNHELAAYHWDKLGGAMEWGSIKRPARAENAELLFLGAPWENLDEALRDNDSERVVDLFNVARGACMACHEAEGVGFMNDQPLLRNTEIAP